MLRPLFGTLLADIGIRNGGLVLGRLTDSAKMKTGTQERGAQKDGMLHTLPECKRTYPCAARWSRLPAQYSVHPCPLVAQTLVSGTDIYLAPPHRGAGACSP